MNSSLFLHQIQLIMHAQQLKHFTTNNDIAYGWLRKKKINFKYISIRQEHLIRQALAKVSNEKQLAVIKHLLNEIENNNLDSSEIPEICLQIIYKINIFEIIQEKSSTGANKLRRSLRLSRSSNKVSPSFLLPENSMKQKKSKSVTFFDHPQIYSIKT